ncbi:MAG TPA: phosphatase PAP2/dual specificity phosphatase family protein [Chthoniobacterales bacterium]|jgi:protein-tyrosine phosphatase
MRRKALAVSAGLSLLFLVVYGGCNWLTAQRHDVGTFFFAWERAIPFVPLAILPYLSIDLFFVAAPFLCRSERELRILAGRIALAILAAGVCFILFPLRFAFPRPETSGPLGFLFDQFRSLDAPYNLAPSLHAALGLLLFDFYFRLSREVGRVAVLVWFAFMAVSPLLTRQHHVIDIATGLALAGGCFYFIRAEGMPRWSGVRGGLVGNYYMMAALVLGLFALFVGSWTLLLWWPALACLLVGLAYLGFGPGIFGKKDGRLPLYSRFVLGPCLAGQWLSFLHYRRQCAAWNEVVPGVWIGRKLSAREALEVIGAGVASVLDLTAEFSEAKPFRRLRYRNEAILDLTAPTLEQLHEMAQFVAEGARNGIVYVHCKIGYSRSVAAVASYLMLSGQAGSVGEAVARIRQVRPTVVVRPEIETVLALLQEELTRSVAA